MLTFAGVSVAAASPSAPAWLAWADFTPDATVADTPGECALLAIMVVPDGASADDPGVVAAREYLADLDLKDVDYTDELAAERNNPVVNPDGTPTGLTRSDVQSDSQLEFFAYHSAIIQMVTDEVERQGIDTSHLSFESAADGCAP